MTDEAETQWFCRSQRMPPYILLPLQNPGKGFPLSFGSFLKKYHLIECCRCLSTANTCLYIGSAEEERVWGTGSGKLAQVHLPLGGPQSQCLQQGLPTTHQGRCLRSRCFSRKIHVSTGRGSAVRGWPPSALPSPRCPAHLISSHSCGPGTARCSTS